MKFRFLFFSILLAPTISLANAINTIEQVKEDLKRLVTVVNSGFTEDKIHFLGTDSNGRLCEVLINKLTLGYVFDRATKGAPQYADEWEYLEYIGQDSTTASREYNYDPTTNTLSETFRKNFPQTEVFTVFEIKHSLQLRPTFGRKMYDGVFLLEHISRNADSSKFEFHNKQVCNLQTFINDDTSGNYTGLILRTGIITKY